MMACTAPSRIDWPLAAAWMARWMSSPSSVKMFAHTCLSSSSWLSKYRYSPGAVMPMSRAMARSDIASGPLSTSSRSSIEADHSGPNAACRTSRNRSAAGATAPASGLYLVNVEY